MSVKVQKYLANLGKSVAYTTADVLSQKFEVVHDFKDENREVFTSAYTSIKNYKTTYDTIKKALTNNKVMDAARIGFDSVVYSVTTGDFYAKSKEQEVISKFGGSLMSDMDIDSDDFDFDNEEVTDGDKVIATAVKKNSKISTAITTEAIVKTGKAQMDVSRENTMLLYTQNERLINKLDGGFENIMGFLKQNGEQSAKVQNQMNENLNKFMTNVDNNLTRVTKQLDEILEMQRVMYKGATADNNQQQKKKIGYDDIITRNGVINIREYAKLVGKNTFGAINDAFGSNLSMLFGDTLGEGSNMLAQLAANPMRELSAAAINKALGKKFDVAARQLNNTLSNIVPDLIARAYSSGKKSDNGLAGILGKIFGIKPGSSESVNTGAYNKGPIPFDGITKRSIVEVIPTYLRKIASSLTGNEEMAYDFNTGKWTTMRNVQQGVSNTLNSGRDNTAALLRSVLEGSTGRRMDTWFKTRDDYKKMSDSLTSLASKIFSSGDITGISRSDLTSQETILYDALMRSFSNGLVNGGYIIDPKTGKRIKSNKQSIVGMNKKLRDIYVSHNAGIKRLNESDIDVARLALAEDIGGLRPGSYHGKSYVNGKGDMDERHIQEMPVAQVMLRAKDEFGVSLYQYLRNMGASLSVIMHNSDYLQILPNLGRRRRGGNGGPAGGGGDNPSSPFTPSFSSISHNASIDYGASTKDEYNGEYYAKKLKSEEGKANDSYAKSLEEFTKRRIGKGKDASIVTDLYQFSGENGSVGLKRLIENGNVDAETAARIEYLKEEEKAEKAKWSKREEWLGKERTDKLRDFDKTIDTNKPILSNLKQAKGVTEKLFIIGKYFSAKSNSSISDKASETILKVDTWLQDLIYGENVKPEDKRRSLFDRMKKNVDDNFRKITETIQNGFDWIKGKMNPILKPVRDFFTKIFGKVDSEGNIESNGLFAPFVSGFRRGMVKNSEDLRQWTKQHAKSTVDKVKEAVGIESTPPAPIDPREAQRASQAAYKERLIAEGKRERLTEFRRAHRPGQIDNEIKKLRDANKALENKKADLTRRISFITSKMNAEKAQMNRLFGTYKNQTGDLKTQRDAMQASIDKYNTSINSFKNSIAKCDEEIAANNARIQQLEQEKAELLNMRTMAAGGVNRTGHDFQSILSPGEYLNGSKISAMGVYTIPKGGVVYNPAPASIRNKQAIQERRFKDKLRSNAGANDNLTPLTGGSQQNDATIAEYEKIINADWTSLEDDRARSIFLGNLASKGVLGGAIGLLAGGPILGASIGAASALTKSSGALANFLFGTSEKDSQGMIKIDEDGNVIRTNDGLISKEIQKAVPDIKKFGAAGLIGGLISPLGPLGGVLVGSALGFAKNSEIFQGTIFGEDGIFSKENTNKLKKGAKNIGAGAIIGALAMPGPFGLVGSALLGATAGYVTSTNKFKDFLLGEEVDGKRRGGVMGTLKDQVVNPLKDFGSTIIDKTMDEIFGVMGNDGKRNGDDGLFGAIRANVIRPMTQGAQSIFKEFTNKLTDFSDMLGDSIKKIKASFAGNDAIGGIMQGATRFAGGIVRGAGAIGRFATKPFRLLGDEGIGGRLKAKRIRTGRADDMTARERLMYRSKLGMADTDAWSATDSALAGMSKDDMTTLLNVLNYDANSGKVDNDLNTIYNHLGIQLREIMPRGDVKRVIKFLKTGKYREAERFVNTRNLPDDVKAQVRGLLSDFRGKVDRVNADYESISKSKVTTQEYLLQRGINVDISDNQKKKNILRMATREMAHFDSGLTEEEREWEAQNKFWSGKDSPLNPVTQAAENIETILQKIYYDLSLGQDYDKLSAEEKARFGSRQGYIEKHRAGAVENAVTAAASNNKISVGRAKFGNVSAKSIRESNFLFNNIINDYLPFYTGNLKDAMSPDNRMDYLSSQFDEIMGTACALFDSEALKVLANPAAIESDIKLYLNQKKFYVAPDDNMFDMVKGEEITRNNIIVTGNGNQTYTFSMTYTVDGKAINPIENQPNSFNNEKQRFVEDYLRAHVPQDQAESYMSFGKMIKTSLKFGAYFSAAMVTGIPIPIFDFLIKHRKGIAKKAKNIISKVAFNAKMIVGSHDIDDSSFVQRIKNEKYKKQAYIAWEKELIEYRKGAKARRIAANSVNRKDEFLAIADRKEAFINSIIEQCGLSGAYDDLNDSDKEKVRDKFVSMYIAAKKEGQLFGRGLIGNAKHLFKRATKSIISKISAPFKKFNDVFLKGNKGRDYRERAENIRKNLEKKAFYALNNIIIPYLQLSPTDRSKEAMDIRSKFKKYKNIVTDVVNDIYPEAHGDLKALPDDMMDEFKNSFVARFSNERYQKLLGDKSNRTLAEKARDVITTLVKSAGRGIINYKNARKADKQANKHKKAVMRALNKAIENNDPKLDEIANSKYQVNFDQLTDEQKSVVAEAYYNEYKENNGFFKNIIRKVTSGKIISLSGEFGKSGKKNREAGSIDRIRAWKEKQQEEDTRLGRIFDKLDARQAKKDKETFKGKKDSKLAKILKWIFVGGIAVPIIVGFVKESLLPAIHDKIQPWLAKAKDKLIGVKNQTTGEYEGGLVSGIVNPIRKFFKDKLSGVHDWFKNEREYKSENTGLKGFIKNIKSVGEYVIGLWKSGANEIFGDLLLKTAYEAGKRAVPILWEILKGAGSWIADLIKGKEKSSNTDFSGLESGGSSVSTQPYTVQANDTFGGKINMEVPSSTTKLSFPSSSHSNVHFYVNSDGNKVFENDATGYTATTEKLKSTYNYASKGDTKFYKDPSSQLEYVMDEETGRYVPVVDYQRVMDESYANNPYAERYKQLAQNNQLQADYTTALGPGAKLAGTAAKDLFMTNNMIIANPALYESVVKRSGNIANTATKILPTTGGKLVRGATKGITKLGDAATNLTVGSQAKLYEKAAKAIAEKSASEAAQQSTRQKIIDKAVQDSTKLGSSGGGIVEKVKAAIKWLKENLGAAFKKLFKSKDAAKAIGKTGAEQSDEIAEAAAKGIGDALDDNVDDIVKSSSNGASNVAKVLSWAMVVVDFVLGWDNCRNILGIIDPKPTTLEKFMGGIVNSLPSLICAIIQTVAVAAGVATGGIAGAIMFGVSIIVSVILTSPKMRNAIIDGLSLVLSKIPGLKDDIDALTLKRQQAIEEVEHENERLGTNMSLEEYNNYIGNETKASKALKGAMNAGSAMLGYDSATKRALKDKLSNLDISYKETEKIKNKLASIFSSIWQKFGEKDFNVFDAYDTEEGNTDKLNASHTKFMDAANQIIANLVPLCDRETQDVRDTILGNTSDFVGPIDAAIHLKSVYKSGKKNPREQFDCSEEHASWGRIKAIAGVCAIMNEIFAPLNNKKEVTRVVVSTMVPIYFGSKKEDEEVINWSEQKYSLDMSKYDDTSSIKSPSTNSASNKFVGPTLPTNANANSKLTPIRTGNARMSQFDCQQAIIDTINGAMNGISGGGFKNVGSVVTELTKRNSQVNRKIDTLKLLPTDDDYWNVKTDEQQPFASSIYSFMENINRVVKAPFSLAAAINSASTSSLISSSSSSSNVGNTATTNTNKSEDTSSKVTSNSNTSFISKIANGLKKVGSTISKFLFGKGKDDDAMYGMGTGDSDSSDPYHIYQRAFNQSYNTAGDREHQSVADSGCGPASAASVLRMYGKQGSMNNAVKFALNNKYKEKDGGTYPQYFTHYFAKNGIASNPNASNADVVNSLAHGNPVVLMGQDKSGSNNTPYGKRYSHYVVARGLDKHGNVIVEDSEDKKGSTRYSLADTLRNTSVRITTGKGYGRASDDDLGVGARYMINVNARISAASAINSALAGSNVQYSNGNTSYSNPSSGNNNGYVGSGNATKAKGKRLTMTDKFGRKFSISITDDEVELFDMLTNKGKFNSAVACGILANWECECGINTIRSVATRGVIRYGGGIMQWTPGDKHVAWARTHGYGSNVWSWEANKAHALWELTEGADQHSWGNPKNAKPSFESVGLTPVSSMEEFRKLTDVESAAANYERVFEVSWNWDGHTSESWSKFDSRNLYDYQRRLYAVLLYDLIVKGKSDDDTTEATSNGTGRGKLNDYLNANNKFGRAEDDEITSTETSTGAESSSESKTNTSPSVSNNGKDSRATGLIQLLSNYTKGVTKGVFGNFYDALYGSQPVQPTYNANDPNNSNGSIRSGSRNDILYAAAMTFEGACSHMEKNSRIARDQTITNIVCKDGTKIDHINVHCNGMMCAIIHYMGYYTVRQSGRSYNDSYHGDSWGAANSFWQEGDRPKIYDADGNLSNDWIFVQPSDGGVQPGDISLACLSGPHMDMYAYTSSGGDRGYNGGANESLERSYQLAKYYLQNGEFPTNKDLGAIGTLRGAKLIIRYVGGSGSGRGKKVDYAKLNAKIPIIHDNNKPAVIHNPKYGVGIWGRDVEENKPTDAITDVTNPSTTATTSSANKKDSKAKTLISKLSEYAKAGIKGVYGNFYDALYGSQPEIEYGNEGNEKGSTASYRGNDVIYAAAMVFEAMGKANPNHIYYADGDKSRWYNLTCRDGTYIEDVRPDCSGIMCAVLSYMGYYHTRWGSKQFSETYHGDGWDLGAIVPGCDIGKYIFNADGSPTKDWVVMSYDPNDEQPGDIRFSVNTPEYRRHTDMYVFKMNGHDYGFSGGGQNPFRRGANLAEYYFNNDRKMPTTYDDNTCQWAIQGNVTTSVLRYVGSGSGRAKKKLDLNRLNQLRKPSKEIYTDLGKIDIPSSVKNVMLDGTTGSSFGYGKAVKSRGGKGIFDGTNQSKTLVNSWSGGNTSTSTTPRSGNTSTYTSTTSSSNSSINISQLIDLVKVIADNSDKIDMIAGLLATIATNTESTTNAIHNKSSSKPPSNGLSALRNALNGDGSGQDLLNAVYKIAQS